MGLFMEDMDFCWRVHAAGYRVRVITDAIAYHAQAASRHRRAVSVGRRVRMLDRRNGLLALLGNLPMRPMVKAAAGNVLVSLQRIAFFLLAKRLAAAMDESSALISVLCHPVRLIRMRARRSRGRRAAYSRVRADLPSGRSARRVVEFVLSTMSRSQPDTSGAHHASSDPTEDDSMLVDNGLGRRLLTSPSLLTFAALLAISLTVGRSLIGSGPLGGGALVPAWGGASNLWASYLQSFHPTGIGSTTAAPPWIAVIAAIATLLGGKAWLAIDVIVIGCVPLAGMTAMLAVRKVSTSPAVRVWASVTYALLPVATGIVASGRFGTAVAFIVLPLILAQVGRMITAAGPRATRAAWATGLLVAIGAAFVPLLWVVTVIACLAAAIIYRATRPGLLRNLVIAALTPPVLLLPWSLTLFSHPADLLLEAGLPQSGAPVGSLPARALMLLSPGGPGLPPYWITAGLVVAALAALLAGRGRRLIAAGWGIAVFGLLIAVLASHLTVRSAAAGQIVVWPGLPLALAALGLLLAAAVGAGALGRLLARVKGLGAVASGRGPWAALLALVACSTPLLAAVAWLSTGVSGPIHPVSKPVVPELVAATAGQGLQVRTLVVSSSGGRVSYLLLRGPSPSMADTALTPPVDAQRALSGAVAALTTPGGGQAADQARLLAELDIGYVLVQAPVGNLLASALSNVSGLRLYSTTSSYTLWQLDTPPARVMVREPGGAVVAIPSGQVGVSGAAVPAAGGTLLLSEPAGGWTASLNGHRLVEVPSPAGSWAQAFRLPKGGGKLSIGYSGFTRDLMLVVELLAFLVVVGLALPGIHVAEQEAPSARRAADAHMPRAAGSRHAVTGELAESGEPPAVAAAGRRTGLAGAAVAAGALQSRSQRLARSTRNRAGRGRLAARERARRAGRSMAGREMPADGQPRDAHPSAPRLADAWPYADQGDAPPDTRLADAWPHAAGESRQTPRSDLLRSEPLVSRDGGDHLDTGPRRGRLTGQPGRAMSYSDEPDRDLGRRLDSSATDPGGELHDGYAEESPGRRAPAAGRPPSGRSASGEWPYADLDAGAAGDRGAGYGRSPSGRSPSGQWPSLDPGDRGDGGERADADRSGWGQEQGTGAYGRADETRAMSGQRPYDEPELAHGAARPVRPDWQPDPDLGYREQREQRRGRLGSWRQARHRSGRPGRDRSAVEPPPAWPGADQALEPLPPVDGSSRRQTARSAWQPAEGGRSWADGGDQDWDDNQWSAPRTDHEAGYGPDYEGDSW